MPNSLDKVLTESRMIIRASLTGIFLLLAMLLSAHASATVFNYLNTTPIAIPDDSGSSGAVCGTPATRTINITDSYTISDLDVGVVIEHTYSSDLRVSLTSPNSTTIQLFAGVTTATDGTDFNIRLNDEASGNNLSNSQSSTSSYPQHLSTAQSSLAAFDGETVTGIWTLSVCDDWSQDDGDIEAFYLHIEDTPSSADPLIVTTIADTNSIGTLRYAINHANANTGDDNITFNISGLGPHQISPTTALPTITDNGVSIDGSTQALTVCGGPTNSTGGLTNRQLRIAIDGSNHSGDLLRINGASNVSIKGIVLANSNSDGLDAVNANNLSLQCNHFGASTDTSGNVGNNGNGVIIGSSSNVLIGDGTLAGANVFGNNAFHGLALFVGMTNTTIRGNFFGIGSNGSTNIGNAGFGIYVNGSNNVTIGGPASGDKNIIGSNFNFGISDVNSTGLKVLGNYIGTTGSGTVARLNGLNGVILEGSINAEIGRIGAANVITSPSVSGTIWTSSSTTATIVGNYLGVAANGFTTLGTPYSGVYASDTSVVTIGDGTAAGANTIRNGVNGGVVVVDTAKAAIISNKIFGNSNLGIDLISSGFGVTLNDSGDGDGGPNEQLNFPIINSFGAEGTTTVNYDINLDVPNNANGYRIEFFKNSNLQSYGQGEIYLGSVDVAHAGGNLNFIGSFTANTAVAIGDYISATTTRKTGASSYDITSEFAATQTAISSTPAVLKAAKTVENLNSGEYSLPGNDVIYTFSVMNEGDGPAATDSIVLIDELPSEIIFFNGDYDGPGPETSVIGFDETATSLTFNPASDALYSNAAVKPADMSECTYTPTAGYDSNVTYLCFNPKGQMLGGNPDPVFNIRFRGRIQ